MITTFVACVVAVFAKDVSCYLRFSVDNSDVIQGLLDGTTLSPSPVCVTTYEQEEDKLPVLVFGTKQVNL